MGDLPDYLLIGKRIEEARILREMNKKTLADKIGKSPSTITRYERGEFRKISTGDIEIIARVLSVNPLWLQGKDVQMERTAKQNIADIIYGKLAESKSDSKTGISSVYGYNSHFSDDEVALIENYRKLNKSDKKNVSNYICFLLSNYTSTKSNKAKEA